MTYTLVIVQSLLMLLLPSRTPAPVSGSWSSARLDVPAVWSIGGSRWILASTDLKHGQGSGASSGISLSLKSDLASLAAIKNGSFSDAVSSSALPGGSLLEDRILTPSLQNTPPAPVTSAPVLLAPASEQYASASRLYFVSSGISGFAGAFASTSASLDTVVSDPVSTPITGGGNSGGITPPDLGGASGHGGLFGGPVPSPSPSPTPEPGGAILTLLGLATACGRRRTRR